MKELIENLRCRWRASSVLPKRGFAARKGIRGGTGLRKFQTSSTLATSRNTFIPRNSLVSRGSLRARRNSGTQFQSNTRGHPRANSGGQRRSNSVVLPSREKTLIKKQYILVKRYIRFITSWSIIILTRIGDI